MTINSVDELKDYIKKNIIPEMTSKTIVLLEGEMGVGKTQFVKLFCEEFGCEKEVSSPTFAIIQEYPSSLGPIHHVDLYRIESSDELENTGFWEIFNKPKGAVFIEWPQKINSKLPSGWKVLRVKYEFVNDSRRIELSLP